MTMTKKMYQKYFFKKKEFIYENEKLEGYFHKFDGIMRELEYLRQIYIY